MTQKWQPGKTYVPGSLVIPRSAPAVHTDALTNPDFEDGLTGWTVSDGSSWSAVTDSPYRGAKCAQYLSDGGGTLLNDAWIDIAPGDRISASAMYKPIHSSDSGNEGHLAIYFFDENKQYLNYTGNASGSWYGSPGQKGGSYHGLSVSASGYAGAKYAKVGIFGSRYDGGGTGYFDAVTVSVVRSQTVTPGLVFKATQAEPGKSGAAEPTWPTTTGVEVTDNEVIWEGVIATRLVWKAVPLLKSGSTEPAWPLEVGAAVHDGTIDWIASSTQITDPNCPHSKIVAIAAGKVYVGDDDIIRYCSTVNPLDWTSTNDAGYLPFGLQTYGSNPVAAMNLYRSNLVPFNAEGFQMWQVDTDPANSTLLDALPVASTYNKALTPVANDLVFLSSQGIRSIGIAASSTNLQAGDVGMPIDVLVKAAMEALGTDDEPRATYLPAMGQVWMAFNAADRESCTVFVYTLNQIGQVGKWSRYVFPFPIDDFAQLNDQLYLRSGDDVLRYDEEALADYVGDEREVVFPGVVQWPWLDLGKPGMQKQLVGFDLVGSGSPSVSIGYDQSNGGVFTAPFVVPADTVPGMIIPLPVMAPSLSLRVEYAGGEKWQLQAVNLYLQDQRPTS